MLSKHDLVHEFPERQEEIIALKVSNNHFKKLFDEYHEINNEIHRIETGAENTTDDYLTSLRKKRLHLKDELLHVMNTAK